VSPIPHAGEIDPVLSVQGHQSRLTARWAVQIDLGEASDLSLDILLRKPSERKMRVRQCAWHTQTVGKIWELKEKKKNGNPLGILQFSHPALDQPLQKFLRLQNPWMDPWVRREAFKSFCLIYPMRKTEISLGPITGVIFIYIW